VQRDALHELHVAHHAQHLVRDLHVLHLQASSSELAMQTLVEGARACCCNIFLLASLETALPDELADEALRPREELSERKDGECA
jgi:hypothetical protein